MYTLSSAGFREVAGPRQDLLTGTRVETELTV